MSWLGFRLWTLTVHPRSYIPPKCLVDCTRKEWGRAASRRCLWGLWHWKSVLRFVPSPLLSAAEMAETRGWTVLKSRTGTFRNYWVWVRLFVGKKETQYLADRWGVGPFSQVGSSGSSFCSEFLWMKLQNQYSETKPSCVTQRSNNNRRPWSPLGPSWLI